METIRIDVGPLSLSVSGQEPPVPPICKSLVMLLCKLKWGGGDLLKFVLESVGYPQTSNLHKQQFYTNIYIVVIVMHLV